MFEKTLLTISSLLVRAFVILLIVIVLAPPIYFAWRAGQPMTMPEFHGLTYYHLLSQRRQAYDQLGKSYQSRHPNVDVKMGMCFGSELVMTAYDLPWAGYCTLAGLAPGLKVPIGPNARRVGCERYKGSWVDIPENWWDMYERFAYDLMRHIAVGAVPYCQIRAP